MMDRSLKALSLLLSYPTDETVEAMPEIGALLAEDSRLDLDARQGLANLACLLCGADLVETQENYVLLFDRSRTLSLNLFEHVHGESRDRGAAMVSLLETYRAAGFEPVTSELPDYLPVLLEFLAMRPAHEMRDILADAAHILATIKARLEARQSLYASVFGALLALSDARADQTAVAEMLAQPDDDPTDLAALDAVWEETEVTFGPDPNAGCPQVRDMLAAMDSPSRRAMDARPVTE